MDINLTLIGQSFARLVFVLFCMKVIWPPIMKAIEERQKEIADGLAAAERGHQSLDKAKAEADEFVDDARKMGIVRMGDRVRVAGTAEFTGNDKTLNPKRIDNLRDFFLGLFPDYPDRDAGESWTGLRPTTPDGLPYLGATPVRGLYLNTGHGHLGWTMSCGSARVLADLITGGDAEIDLSGMTLDGR